jgi:hypothetical protein
MANGKIIIDLPPAFKKELREAIKNYNKRNPLEKTTYTKVALPAYTKFIKENKKNGRIQN